MAQRIDVNTVLADDWKFTWGGQSYNGAIKLDTKRGAAKVG